MTAVYHLLAGGDLLQDWSDTGLIAMPNENDWGNVPSIIGYLGDIPGTASGIDPRTQTANNSSGVPDVHPDGADANGEAPGVVEFELENPTVALAGGATQDIPHLILYLDATGRTAVRLQASLRDLRGATGNNPAGNTVQPVNVQYRIDPDGDWINVPGGYLADVTADDATQTTLLDVLLPAEAAGAATLQIRIMTANAAGNDEWVGIDDIQVSSTPFEGALSVADAAVTEGDAGTTEISFTVSRAGGTSGTVAVEYAIELPGGAGGADSGDFAPGETFGGILGFADGETSRIVTLHVQGDTDFEPDETFTITLSNAGGGAEIGDGVATGTIGNDDNVAPTVDLDGAADGADASASYTEGEAGTPIGADIAVADPDEAGGDRIERATVTLDNALAGDALSLAGPLPAGIALDPTSTGALLKLVGAAPAADYAAALALVRFASDSQDPTAAGAAPTRTIATFVQDGELDSAVATTLVTIGALDDAAVAEDDAFATDEATSIGGNLFADNGAGADGDVDGPALAVAAVNGSAAAVDNPVALPSGALLTVHADGTFSYDPNHRFDATPAAGSGATNQPAGDGFSYTLAGGGTATVALTVAGLDSSDLLVDSAGIDLLAGGLGNDRYFVRNAADAVSEAANAGYDGVYVALSYALAAGAHVELLATSDHLGSDAINLTGNGFNNLVVGNQGANRLDGGGGNDTLDGRGGNDVYLVDSAADRIIENGGGYDIAYAAASFALTAGAAVEVLATINNLAATAIDLAGNEHDNLIIGNAGGNFLDGGGGRDYLDGRGGNDSYLVDQAGDVVLDAAGQGYDIVYASASYVLGAGQEVEVLATADNLGTAAINLTGNEYNDSISGNAGNNVLNGGGGRDYLAGRGGNDSYLVDHVLDRPIELAGEGLDAVYASVDYALAGGTEIEILATANNLAADAIDLTGNDGSNFVVGNAGANVLNGGLGADYLDGRGGADTFAFTTAPGAGNVDTILSFQAGSDKVALDNAVFAGLAAGALDAGAFVTGSAAADADDRIVYDSAAGALYFDADGSGATSAVQFAAIGPGLALAASDFTVI